MSLAVALTLGDPAGIGGEIALKAWSELRGEVPFFLIGDLSHMTGIAGALDLPLQPIERPQDACVAGTDGLPVLDHALPRPAPPGMPDPGNATAVIEIIARGVELTRSGAALALCTNPINKKALKDGASFPFPGHTEYLASLCDAPLPVMMLVARALRVVPVTIHIPLAQVPTVLTADMLERTLRITHRALITDVGIANPRIAVAGLNPHAGEQGAIGKEEITLIAPVLASFRREGIVISGPLSADTLFHAAAREQYDVAVCMYHDQALIPLKTLDFDGGVNVTLGLDFVRTSPDHGTAYDIAGKMRASPTSLIAALRMAWDLGERRRTMRSLGR